MTSTICTRLMVTAALLFVPIAASAQNNRASTTQLAQNSAATAVPVAQPDVKAAPAAAPEKKICKLLPSTGTRMNKRACLTESEWKQVEKDLQD
jgi:hypothetical protein